MDLNPVLSTAPTLMRHHLQRCVDSDVVHRNIKVISSFDTPLTRPQYLYVIGKAVLAGGFIGMYPTRGCYRTF